MTQEKSYLHITKPTTMVNSRETILNELRNNPKVIAYAAPYSETSVQSFLESYASTKELLLNYGEHYRNVKDRSTLHYRAWAEKYYWQIAQKKLFNLQCLWRAQQVDLPIEVTFEFFHWGQNIKACPFIEPVTDLELNTMIEFLEATPYDQLDDYILDWQAYKDFKDPDDPMGPGDEYPDWYEWYDVHIGPHGVLALPDLRGAYEDKCFSVLGAAQREAIMSMATPGKPYLSTDQLEDFIKQVETYQIYDYYRAYSEWSRKHEKMESLESELKLLYDEPGEVRIPEGRFPDAIFQAAYLLRVKKIKDLLYEVHQQHLEQLDMGISYELIHDDFIATCRANFNKARKLLEDDEV